MNTTHLVTGGTGFVGSAIILELLRRTDVMVVSIVRPGSSSAHTRLQQALLKAARAYEYDETVIQAIKERCRAVAGDVSQEACGVDIHTLPHIAQFWHCAASLRYEDRFAGEIFQTNTEGTRHAVELARRIGVRDHFNYMSTAYVAGRQTGAIAEELHPLPSPHIIPLTNNHYETSKLRAEHIVAGAADLSYRIMRPSVVIGHSRLFTVASGFSGLYGFMRKLLQFKGAMSRVQEGLLTREPLRMRVDSDALLNLIPVDMVAEQAVRIGMSSTTSPVFHLTNATPPTVADFLLLLFKELELHTPLFVETKKQFNWIDQKLDLGITFYQSYLVASKRFERRNADVALGDTHAGDYDLSAQMLRAFFQWYLDLLAVERPRLVATR